MTHPKTSARYALAACLAYCSITAANADDAGTYAVISLIGDSIRTSPYTGALPMRLNPSASRLDQHQYVSLPVASNAFDAVATGDVAADARQRLPNATFDVLQVRTPSLYALQDKVFDGSADGKQARDALIATLQQRNATFLIAVTRHRTHFAETVSDPHLYSDANLRVVASMSAGPRQRNRLREPRLATGDLTTIEGLGFYVDDTARVQNLSTLDFGNGVLVAYADLTVRLLDARTLAVIREATARKRAIIAVSRPLESAFNAWGEVTDERKLKSLQQLLDSALADAVPQLLNAPAR